MITHLVTIVYRPSATSDAHNYFSGFDERSNEPLQLQPLYHLQVTISYGDVG